jgi:hypothetical protein
MAASSNKIPEFPDESGWIAVGRGNLDEIADCTRSNSLAGGEGRDVNGRAVEVERSRNRNDDSGNPTENKNRVCQGAPCCPGAILNENDELFGSDASLTFTV